MQTWVSEPFTTKPTLYMKRLISMWLNGRWWMIVAFVSVFTIASAFDLRFFLVALMLTFLVYPMLMAILCINYLLTPNARRAVLNKRVELRYPESLIIIYPGADDSEETIFPSETITLRQIRKIRIISNDIVVILNGRKLDFIIIPMQSFGNQSINVARALFESQRTYSS